MCTARFPEAKRKASSEAADNEVEEVGDYDYDAAPLEGKANKARKLANAATRRSTRAKKSPSVRTGGGAGGIRTGKK